ncbi:MAG: DUF721 domain-containing protein [Bryobacterales bacterium]|nr:DUF721 domain-containing protein [Bryobacterales bacterium]
MDLAIKLLNDSGQLKSLESIDQKLRRCWKTAVGGNIAKHSRVLQLRGSVLLVGVDDTVWKTQLDQLAPYIMERIRSTSGIEGIERVSFRVVAPRIRPKAAPATAASADEADRIEDPLLRSIYKDSRRKAQV